MSYIAYLRAVAQAVTAADKEMLANPEATVADWMNTYLDRMRDA
jgi:hypothetical protein